jgi:hypothetical protein
MPRLGGHVGAPRRLPNVLLLAGARSLGPAAPLLASTAVLLLVGSGSLLGPRGLPLNRAVETDEEGRFALELLGRRSTRSRATPEERAALPTARCSACHSGAE